MGSDPALEQRQHVLAQFQEWSEAPMMALALLWVGLFVGEVVLGLNAVWEAIGGLIWLAFLLEFAVGLVLAPSRAGYVRGHWLGLLALLAPGVRLFRLLGVAKAAWLARGAALARTSRGLRLLRAVSSVNRAMAALGRSMGRRGLGYVFAVSVLVALVGAAGIYGFEHRGPQAPGIRSFAEALWWTAMLMTTLGSDFWPTTAEGRALCFLLSLYAVGVFGYFTAALATYFIGRDADDSDAEVVGRRNLSQLHVEVRALRRALRRLDDRQRPQP